MKPIKVHGLAMVLVILICGCSASWDRLQGKVSPSTDVYSEKARNHEKRGELRQAILSWQVAAHLEEGNANAREEIQRLEDAANAAARDHFQQGLTQYQSGDYGNARRQFLIALRYKPDHREALYYVKTRLQNPEQAAYRVQAGDSFIRIAKKFYDDTSKAYTIAYFNDLDPQKPLLIGTRLLLPSLDTSVQPSLVPLPSPSKEQPKPRSNITIMLERAQKAYERKQYDKVLALTRKIQKESPGHRKARHLADAVNFDQGMRLLKRKRYLAAVEYFKLVSPNFKGRKQAISEARRHIKQVAVDEKLVEAQQYLRNNDWGSVISVTEEILDQDPDNAQAKMLFSNASYNLGKQMLDRGDVARAAALLKRIDPSYEDTGQLLSTARARMKSQAEVRYRDGVKHFINEDLEMAIKDWRRALELNPKHPKARQDIENAERLLEKLQTLDKESPDKP